MTGRVQPSGSGAGHRRDPAPIVDAVLDLGVDEVLVRVEWARLVPTEGRLDEGEVAWVSDQLARVRAEGRRTGIVLTDGAVPAWMGPEAWLMPATPERLARLAVDLVSALGGLVDVVVPVEEPGTWCLAGWVAGAAPPLRVGAVRDALAALDGMLSGQLLVEEALSEAAPPVEVAWLASAGPGQEAERALLGLPGAGSLIERPFRSLAARGPGRTSRLRASTGATGGQAILPFGADAPSPIAPLASVLWAAVAAAAPLATSAAEALHGVSSGPVGLRLVHAAATIDERGRTSRLRGHHRLALLTEALDEARHHGAVRRLVVGEATDRWRWGSYRRREGLFAVDRTRGARGYELDALDAAGIDAGGGVAGLLRSP